MDLYLVLFSPVILLYLLVLFLVDYFTIFTFFLYQEHHEFLIAVFSLHSLTLVNTYYLLLFIARQVVLYTHPLSHPYYQLLKIHYQNITFYDKHLYLHYHSYVLYLMEQNSHFNLFLMNILNQHLQSHRINFYSFLPLFN